MHLIRDTCAKYLHFATHVTACVLYISMIVALAATADGAAVTTAHKALLGLFFITIAVHIMGLFSICGGCDTAYVAMHISKFLAIFCIAIAAGKLAHENPGSNTAHNASAASAGLAIIYMVFDAATAIRMRCADDECMP